MRRLLSLVASAIFVAAIGLATTATPVFAAYYGTCDSYSPEMRYQPYVYRDDSEFDYHYWAVQAEIKNYHHMHACLNGNPPGPTNPESIICPVNMQDGPANAVPQICIGAVRGEGEHFWWTVDTHLHLFSDVTTEPPIGDGRHYKFYIWSRTVNGVDKWHFRVDDIDSEGFATTYEFDRNRNNSVRYTTTVWWGFEAYNAQSQLGGQDSAPIQIDNLQYRYVGDSGSYTYATWPDFPYLRYNTIQQGNVPTNRYHVLFWGDPNHCFSDGTCAEYVKAWTTP